MSRGCSTNRGVASRPRSVDEGPVVQDADAQRMHRGPLDLAHCREVHLDHRADLRQFEKFHRHARVAWCAPGQVGKDVVYRWNQAYGHVEGRTPRDADPQHRTGPLLNYLDLCEVSRLVRHRLSIGRTQDTDCAPTTGRRDLAYFTAGLPHAVRAARPEAFEVPTTAHRVSIHGWR